MAEKGKSPKAKKATRPAGHTAPGKRQLNLAVSDATVERLEFLRHRRAAELAEQSGRAVNADRLGTMICEELIYRAYREAKAGEADLDSDAAKP